MNMLDKAVERASRLSPLEMRLVEALGECQKVLVKLTDPPRQKADVITIWAQCVAAELLARQAIAAAAEIENKRAQGKD